MIIDPDGTLPVERTALAWGRTLLGLSGVLGLAAADAIYAARVAAAMVLAILAVVAVVLSWSVARRRSATLSAEEHRLDSPRATMSLAAVVVAVSVTAFVVVLL